MDATTLLGVDQGRFSSSVKASKFKYENLLVFIETFARVNAELAFIDVAL